MDVPRYWLVTPTFGVDLLYSRVATMEPWKMSASGRLITELLSPREREVLELVAQGRTNESIAHRLSVAVKTVETVIRSIFDKLGFVDSPDSNRRVLAATWYIEHALSGPAMPVWRTPLVGRDAEIEDLGSIVDAHGIVSVIGLGGAGKTRLVAEYAANRARSGVEVRFVDLVPARRLDDVVRLVCEVSGLRFSTIDASVRRLKELFGRRVLLLVLDNAEHVAVHVRMLLDDVTRRDRGPATVVVTSRVPIGSRSEFVWSVPPLSDEHIRTLLLSHVQHRLETSALDVLVPAADGLPLAAEILAARVVGLGSHVETAQVRGLLLSGGGLGAGFEAVLRSATLVLGTPALTAMRALSVYPLDWDMDAVAATNAATEPFAIIEELVRAGIAVPCGLGRWRMLEPVRQYAEAERIRLGESDAAFRAMIDWAVGFTSRNSAGFMDPDDGGWRRRFLHVLPAIDVALACAIESNDARAALSIVGGTGFVRYGSHTGNASDLALEVLKMPGAERRTTRRAWAVLTAGMLAANERADSRAQAYFDEATELFVENRNTLGEAVGRSLLAMCSMSTHDLDAAATLTRNAGLTFLEGWVQNTWAFRDMTNGDLTKAKSRYETTERLGIECGHPDVIAASLVGQAELLTGQLSQIDRLTDLLARLDSLPSSVEGSMWSHTEHHTIHVVERLTRGDIDGARAKLSATIDMMAASGLDEANMTARCIVLGVAILVSKDRGDVASRIFHDARCASPLIDEKVARFRLLGADLRFPAVRPVERHARPEDLETTLGVVRKQLAADSTGAIRSSRLDPGLG